VPQILNGMMTPEGLYRFGEHGLPVLPAKGGPLQLVIYPLSDPFGRLQPHLYDFNPLHYLDTFRGDVARDLSAYIGWADDPTAASTKITRQGDQVTIDMGGETSYNRYTLDLGQGCNPIRCEGVSPRMTSQWQCTYELRDSIWLPKTWTETVRQTDVRDEDRKVTFVEHVLNQPVGASAFDISRLGLRSGDQIDDRKTQRKYLYEVEQP
jgi:hypothetical protein